MLRLGYKASAEQFGPNELLGYSVLAETRGFDSVFISDHFQPWRHTGGHAPFSMAWMGALGARTSRILMGTSVLTPTFRYHPSVVAQAFGTLGFGTGVARSERTHGAAQGGVDLDPATLERRAGEFQRPVLQHRQGHDL